MRWLAREYAVQALLLQGELTKRKGRGTQQAEPPKGAIMSASSFLNQVQKGK